VNTGEELPYNSVKLIFQVIPSDDPGDEGGISDWVTLKQQATDPKSHTFVRIFFT
jgi:hypothetical protein